MLYRPPLGRFMGCCVFWHAEKYFLFGMYSAGTWSSEGFRSIWLATSDDGVHWRDVGPVVADAPFPIYGVGVHKVGNRFVLNHGSFTPGGEGSAKLDWRDPPGVQNVLRFWESPDLSNWRYMGSKSDVFPDPRWYSRESRLDCMSVMPIVENGRTKYYGYATGPGGFLQSDDGLQWSGMPRPVLDWGGLPPPSSSSMAEGLEMAGCAEIGGKYYLVGGTFNYAAVTGYSSFTLVGDSPSGPFRADTAFRLCGNSRRWVSIWAHFCQTQDELLASGFMYGGYNYETEQAWIAPLKKAVVDVGGHLRLGYWYGNEALKGRPLPVTLQSCIQVYPRGSAGSNEVSVVSGRLSIQARPELTSDADYVPSKLSTTVAVLDKPLDMRTGVVVGGTIQATGANRRHGSPAAGLFLDEGADTGTAILLRAHGVTEVGKVTMRGRLTFECEDEIGLGCALVAGIVPHQPHRFRLLVRGTMFELYLDDLLVQTFNTAHDPQAPGRVPQRIGFVAQNGEAIFEDVTIWQMSLDAVSDAPGIPGWSGREMAESWVAHGPVL